MKKVVCFLLTLALLACLLPGCGKDSDAPTTQATPDAAPDTTAQEPVSVLRILNLDPDREAIWLDLAQRYADRSDVTVEVLTADTLPEELDEKNSPALLIGGEDALMAREDSLLDLTGTSLYQELTDIFYAIADSAGTARAAVVGSDVFGMVADRKLLEEAGRTAEEICDFTSLKCVAEDVHSKAHELGFDAFDCLSISDTAVLELVNSALYHGGTESAYLSAVRNLWDLAIANSPAELTEEAEKSRAVFHFAGSWELDALAKLGLTEETMTVLPIYCGVDGEWDAGLSCRRDCWAVNAQAPQEDVQAALGFLYWAVTDADALAALAECYSFLPYKSDSRGTNPFLIQAMALETQGKYNVEWAFTDGGIEDRAGEIADALEDYAQVPTDENWAAVEKAILGE